LNYERLAARHRDAVYLQMVRACGNYEDAEDVLVEALLAAYRALPTIHDEGAFRGWLAVVGRRACSRLKKREALQPIISLNSLSEDLIEGADPGSDAQIAAELEDTAKRVHDAVQSLPEGLRKVYVAREMEGESAEKVAERFGISIPALKSRLHRARKEVRRTLDGSINSA